MAALLKKMVLFLALILVLIGAGGYIFIKTHEVFAANFADDVLRPLIGGKTTIALEALFFKFQDTINKATYGFGNPIKGPFSKNGTTLKKINILECCFGEFALNEKQKYSIIFSLRMAIMIIIIKI